MSLHLQQGLDSECKRSNIDEKGSLSFNVGKHPADHISVFAFKNKPGFLFRTILFEKVLGVSVSFKNLND